MYGKSTTADLFKFVLLTLASLHFFFGIWSLSVKSDANLGRANCVFERLASKQTGASSISNIARLTRFQTGSPAQEQLNLFLQVIEELEQWPCCHVAIVHYGHTSSWSQPKQALQCKTVIQHLESVNILHFSMSLPFLKDASPQTLQMDKDKDKEDSDVNSSSV